MTNKRQYPNGQIALFIPNRDNSSKISPKEFLSWAEKDLKSQDKRARGNALSNIKKALHARLDEIIAKTHLRFSHDWNARNFTTDNKLEVIRKIGIKHDAIVNLITVIRNKYEHQYIVPSLDVVRAHQGTCDLWLEKSYSVYEFHSIGFVNLPLIGLGSGMMKANGSVINHTKFDVPTKVIYFWNSKKSLVTILPNGTIEQKYYSAFSCKEMLRFEAPLIRKYFNSSSGSAYNQASLTEIYGRYRKWLGKITE